MIGIIEIVNAVLAHNERKASEPFHPLWCGCNDNLCNENRPRYRAKYGYATNVRECKTCEERYDYDLAQETVDDPDFCSNRCANDPDLDPVIVDHFSSERGHWQSIGGEL